MKISPQVAGECERTTMMVFIAQIISPAGESPVVRQFHRLMERQTARDWMIASDPESADLILFVDLHLCHDPQLRPLRSNPLLLEFPGKCMVYDERDEPWCALPGVYVSMPRSLFDPRRQRAFGYYGPNDATVVESGIEPDLLFSFIGTSGHRTSDGHRVRREILALRHERAIIEDSGGFVFYDHQGSPAWHRQRQQRFAEVMGRSRFVLCPRGRGTSSIRMYETLRAGRVPVVLADEWVEPVGPDWEGCSLRVAEQDAYHVPALIEANEHRWPQMAAAARATYEQWFAPSVVVQRILDQCKELLSDVPRAVSPWRDRSFRAMRIRSLRQAGRRLAGASLRATGFRR
jgi:hypothetical protein